MCCGGGGGCGSSVVEQHKQEAMAVIQTMHSSVLAHWALTSTSAERKQNCLEVGSLFFNWHVLVFVYFCRVMVASHCALYSGGGVATT